LFAAAPTGTTVHVQDRHLWVQNEDTLLCPSWWIRRSFDKLLTGDFLCLITGESLACLKPPAGFKVELVAQEPLVQARLPSSGAPTATLVVETRDYPLGMDGKGQPGGVIKYLGRHGR